ncbi:MAG: heavy-metal-associated domain-containing protein [Clostridiaceae bacterium]|nr:heavy-metal-associated domain-containing protein [Clostridiaceae bacterium]
MKKKIIIEGMSCQHCKRHVEEALKELSGVVSVYADVEGGFAEFEATQDIEDSQIKNAIEEAGYQVIRIE